MGKCKVFSVQVALCVFTTRLYTVSGCNIFDVNVKKCGPDKFPGDLLPEERLQETVSSAVWSNCELCVLIEANCRSLALFAGSSPAGGMDICFL